MGLADVRRVPRPSRRHARRQRRVPRGPLGAAAGRDGRGRDRDEASTEQLEPDADAARRVARRRRPRLLVVAGAHPQRRRRRSPCPSRFATARSSSLCRPGRARPPRHDAGVHPGRRRLRGPPRRAHGRHVARGRPPLNWNVLAVNSGPTPKATGTLLAASRPRGRAAAAGCWRSPSPTSCASTCRSSRASCSTRCPGWAATMALAPEEKLRVLSDPAERARLRDAAASPEAGMLGALARWERMTVVDTVAPGEHGLRGSDRRRHRGRAGQVDPFDALRRHRARRRAQHRRDATCRRRGRRVVEDARRRVARPAGGRRRLRRRGPPRHALDLRLQHRDAAGGGRRSATCSRSRRPSTSSPTCRPASTGCASRGRVAEGWQADLVVLDPDRVGPGPVHTRFDLPGWCRAPLRRGRGHRARARERHRDRDGARTSPATPPAPSCAPAATPTR